MIFNYDEFNAVIKPHFEKVSRVADQDFELPKRGTKGSAAYDFFLLEDVTICPRESVIVPTGVKAYMPEDMALLMVVRSSVGIKDKINFLNQMAVIDSDFYNNEKNEGEISLALVNAGQKIVHYKKGDRVAQGLFINYQTTSDDVPASAVRSGGIGSTNK